MFAAPALSALTGGQGGANRRGARYGLALLLIAFAVLIGARFEVGGDWVSYEEINEYIRHETLAASMSFGDPGFGFVSWVLSRVGLGAAGPSMFCGSVLIYGLWRFGKSLADPWLAVTAAVPYLLIVVGMGYVRQGAAIGFVLIALTQFEQGRVVHFLKWVGVATLFHVSAILVLPLAAFVVVRKRPIAFVPLAALGAALYVFLLAPRMDRFYENYVVAEYDSSGAFVRLAMNAVPATIFLIYRKRFPVTEASRAFWTSVAVLSLALVALVLVSPATTALDRIGLYCIPIQLFVFGNIGAVITRTIPGRRLVSIAAVTYYAGVLFIWLNYATNAENWIPYKFQPIF